MILQVRRMKIWKSIYCSQKKKLLNHEIIKNIWINEMNMNIMKEMEKQQNDKIITKIKKNNHTFYTEQNGGFSYTSNPLNLYPTVIYSYQSLLITTRHDIYYTHHLCTPERDCSQLCFFSRIDYCRYPYHSSQAPSHLSGSTLSRSIFWRCIFSSDSRDDTRGRRTDDTDVYDHHQRISVWAVCREDPQTKTLPSAWRTPSPWKSRRK